MLWKQSPYVSYRFGSWHASARLCFWSQLSRRQRKGYFVQLHHVLDDVVQRSTADRPICRPLRSPLQRRFPLTTRSASLIAYGIMDLWVGSGPAVFVTLGIPLFNFLQHSYILLHRYARNVSLQIQTLMDFDRSVTLVNRGTYDRRVFLFPNRAITFARSAVTSTTHTKTLLTRGGDSLQIPAQ